MFAVEKAFDYDENDTGNAVVWFLNSQKLNEKTTQDESSLVESIFVGIPIPPVFMSSTRYRGVQVLDVVDGQHRLNTFFALEKDYFS